MLNQHSTQTESYFAISTIKSTNEWKLPKSPIDEWISGSAIASSLTEKWLVPISDPDEIAILLNWKYYNHTVMCQKCANLTK